MSGGFARDREVAHASKVFILHGSGKISPMRANERKNAALMRNQLTNDNEGEIQWVA
jgi:hypothetical protein